jgi:hypothetical protein
MHWASAQEAIILSLSSALCGNGGGSDRTKSLFDSAVCKSGKLKVVMIEPKTGSILQFAKAANWRGGGKIHVHLPGPFAASTPKCVALERILLAKSGPLFKCTCQQIR